MCVCVEKKGWLLVIFIGGGKKGGGGGSPIPIPILAGGGLGRVCLKSELELELGFL